MEGNARQQATFRKTQHRRARARAEATRNDLKRLKPALNELVREVSRPQHDLAKLRKRFDERGNARLKARDRKPSLLRHRGGFFVPAGADNLAERVLCGPAVELSFGS